VKIDLPDGPRILGEVDYLTEKFIGLRTSDELIRFHERSAIGLPVAVSDHCYGALADPRRRTESWQHWLAAAIDHGAQA
jgi:hypothetical protein